VLHLLPGELAASAPYLITQRPTLSSPHTDFFYPLVKAGELVYPGGRLGYVTDLFGRPLADSVAPVTGVVLYMSATLPISRGESFFSIGQVAGARPWVSAAPATQKAHPVRAEVFRACLI